MDEVKGTGKRESNVMTLKYRENTMNKFKIRKVESKQQGQQKRKNKQKRERPKTETINTRNRQ